MELPPLLELPPLTEMEQGNSRRQEDLGLQVGSLISGLLVRCASSPNPWQDRSPGSCHWRSLESLLLPGSGVHACKATGSSNRWSFGARGCSPWSSSLAWRVFSPPVTLRVWLPLLPPSSASSSCQSSHPVLLA